MIRNVLALASSLIIPAIAAAQGRPLDWSFYGGDGGRSGWQKTDIRIIADNVKDFELVLKRKLGDKQVGSRSLTPPVVIGLLISYRGFKELGFISGGSDSLWSIDLDMDRVFWTRHFEKPAKPSSRKEPSICAGAAVATPSLTPPVNFAARPKPGTAAASTKHGVLGSTNFGAPRPAFALSSDGKLHFVNTSNGEDLAAAIPFLPAGAKASSLAISDGAIYTTTIAGCGGAPSGVWSMDLSDFDPRSSDPAPKPTFFASNGGAISSIGGLAFGADSTVYVQTGDGPSDPGANKWSNTLLALTPKNLQVKQYFSVPGAGPASLVTPVVFSHGGHDLIVTAGSNGVLYLLDSASPGGVDHKTPLSQTLPLTIAGRGIWGGLSSWQDADGVRWVVAPVWGALNPALKLSANSKSGSIVAFKVEEQNGFPVLTPAWASAEIAAPQPPVITSGIVFALSSGDYSADRKASGHATLYALDGTTGKELYNSGNQVTAPANLTGMAIANGRVFFTTTDNTLYGFGVHLER